MRALVGVVEALSTPTRAHNFNRSRLENGALDSKTIKDLFDLFYTEVSDTVPWKLFTTV